MELPSIVCSFEHEVKIRNMRSNETDDKAPKMMTISLPPTRDLSDMGSFAQKRGIFIPGLDTLSDLDRMGSIAQKRGIFIHGLETPADLDGGNQLMCSDLRSKKSLPASFADSTSARTSRSSESNWPCSINSAESFQRRGGLIFEPHLIVRGKAKSAIRENEGKLTSSTRLSSTRSSISDSQSTMCSESCCSRSSTSSCFDATQKRSIFVSGLAQLPDADDVAAATTECRMEQTDTADSVGTDPCETFSGTRSPPDRSSSVCSTASSDQDDVGAAVDREHQPAIDLGMKMHPDSAETCERIPQPPPKAKYFKQKLESWFRDVIDGKSVGHVNFREFMATLRQNQTLQITLCAAASVPFSEIDQKIHAKLSTNGLLALSVPERSRTLLQERRRIKDVFHAFCGGVGDKTLDLPTFLAFFHQRGLIIFPRRGGA